MGLTPERIFGADVRVIASPGFTFIPLKAEEETVSQADTSAQILPELGTASIDMVTVSMVMHHVIHPRKTLLELRRVISDTGMDVFCYV